MVKFLEKGYILVVTKRTTEDRVQSQCSTFGIVTCKKLRIGEAIYNLVAVLNPERSSFGENLWASGGSKWNKKLRRELRQHIESNNNHEWIEISDFCRFFKDVLVYRVKS
jgi:hypothetical protein